MSWILQFFEFFLKFESSRISLWTIFLLLQNKFFWKLEIFENVLTLGKEAKMKFSAKDVLSEYQ